MHHGLRNTGLVGAAAGLWSSVLSHTSSANSPKAGQDPEGSCRAAHHLPLAAGSLSPPIRFLHLLSEATAEGNAGYTVTLSLHTAVEGIIILIKI